MSGNMIVIDQTVVGRLKVNTDMLLPNLIKKSFVNGRLGIFRENLGAQIYVST